MMTSRYRWIHLFMRIRAPCFLLQWQREEGENQEVEFLTWLWVFDSASSPEYDETTPDSSRERGNARATKDCKVKQEKLVRAPRLHNSGSAGLPKVRRLSVEENHRVEESLESFA